MESAFANLLQNAVDFSPMEKSIWIRAREESARVTIEIEDEGPGIPDYAAARVFERFYSLPRPATG